MGRAPVTPPGHRRLLSRAAQALPCSGRAGRRPERGAGYCLHALTAAAAVTNQDAVHRLVTVTLTGLRAPRR